MSMQFNDIIMYTDLCENKSIHNMLRLVFYNCMIWDTVQKYMVYNNAENKRWVEVAIPTLVQRQNTTLLQRWIMTSTTLSFSTNIQRQFLTLFQRLSNVNCLLVR